MGYRSTGAMWFSQQALDAITKEQNELIQRDIENDSFTFVHAGNEAKSHTDGDGFTWKLVSQKYAKQNWKNEEIYWLDTSNDTESLIDEDNYENYTSPDFSDELFGMEIGFEADTIRLKSDNYGIIDGVLLEFESWKWYESYPDIAMYESMFKLLTDGNIPYDFVRIGEDAGDIEQRTGDKFVVSTNYEVI